MNESTTPTIEATVQKLKDAVVHAAVEWHQSGREGDDTWFDKAEALGIAIDALLELREPSCVCGTATDVFGYPNGH